MFNRDIKWENCVIYLILFAVKTTRATEREGGLVAFFLLPWLKAEFLTDYLMYKDFSLLIGS